MDHTPTLMVSDSLFAYTAGPAARTAPIEECVGLELGLPIILLPTIRPWRIRASVLVYVVLDDSARRRFLLALTAFKKWTAGPLTLPSETNRPAVEQSRCGAIRRVPLGELKSTAGQARARQLSDLTP